MSNLFRCSSVVQDLVYLQVVKAIYSRHQQPRTSLCQSREQTSSSIEVPAKIKEILQLILVGIEDASAIAKFVEVMLLQAVMSQFTEEEIRSLLKAVFSNPAVLKAHGIR